MPNRNLALFITAVFGLALLPGFIARFFPAFQRSPRTEPIRCGHRPRGSVPHGAGR
jgi:hypothetical protein